MDISWNNVRHIFGEVEQPRVIWEEQFDDFTDELKRLCNTPWSEIDHTDLWYYYHDLAYVDLQPEVFRYLFPVCLMAWHESLKQNTSCSAGDAEFHNGVHKGTVFQKMVSPQELTAICNFLRDSFVSRLDQERGFVYQGSKTPAYGWMCRFNSLGIVLPMIDIIWDSWWMLDTPGKAVAAVEYLSGLIYPLGQNHIFPQWTPQEGGGDPPLLSHDSHILDSGWKPNNIDVLRRNLTLDFVRESMKKAVKALAGQPEFHIASQVEINLHVHLSTVEARIAELPDLLAVINEGPTWRQ